jgi:gastric triacylglycerol lipase
VAADHFAHPEAFYDFVTYCKFYNYPVQVHTINTDDGYILTYFRIQAKNQTTFKTGLPVLWLQHGILDSSDTWIVNSEPEDLAPAFYFANKGYDIWLGNSRGNKHSRNHVFLNPDKDDAFWDFTWQDMADYDLPAGFKYITTYTGQQRISYAGHSQGTTQMWAALSEGNPVVKAHLKHFLAIAPVSYIGNCGSTLLNILARRDVIFLLKLLNVQEFLSPNWFLTNAGVEVCRVFNFLCKEGVQVIADSNPDIDNYERMDVVLGHFPSGTSLKTLNHWNQILVDDTFRKFDYGSPEANMKHYNSTTPPKYDISKVDVPVSLFVGTEDKLGDVTDARRLKDELINTPYKFYKEYVKGHVTFVWGKDMSYLAEVEQEMLRYRDA